MKTILIYSLIYLLGLALDLPNQGNRQLPTFNATASKELMPLSVQQVRQPKFLQQLWLRCQGLDEEVAPTTFQWQKTYSFQKTSPVTKSSFYWTNTSFQYQLKSTDIVLPHNSQIGLTSGSYLCQFPSTLSPYLPLGHINRTMTGERYFSLPTPLLLGHKDKPLYPQEVIEKGMRFIPLKAPQPEAPFIYQLFPILAIDLSELTTSPTKQLLICFFSFTALVTIFLTGVALGYIKKKEEEKTKIIRALLLDGKEKEAEDTYHYMNANNYLGISKIVRWFHVFNHYFQTELSLLKAQVSNQEQQAALMLRKRKSLFAIHRSTGIPLVRLYRWQTYFPFHLSQIEEQLSYLKEHENRGNWTPHEENTTSVYFYYRNNSIYQVQVDHPFLEEKWTIKVD